MKEFRLDVSQSLDSLNVTEKDNGIVVFQNATLLREGPMPYERAADDKPVRWEHIDGDEIDSEPILASAANAPVTDGHPPKFVTSDNIDLETRGVTARDLTVREAEDARYGKVKVLEADLIVFNPELAAKIEDGKSHISTGRRVEIVHDEGEFKGQKYDVRQTDMEINHVGVVDEGRCGETCSIDEGVSVQSGISFEKEDIIREVGNEYCIFSEEGERLECHDTKEKAEKRLAEIEFFSSEESEDSEFNDFINQKIEEVDKPRDDVVAEVAQLSNRTTQEVFAQIGGVIRPAKSVVGALSQVLGVEDEEFLRLLPFNDLEVDTEQSRNNNTIEEDEALEIEDGENFGEWLTNLIARRARQGSESESELVGRIAENSGRSESTVNRWRRGEGDCPPAELLEAIASVLDVKTSTAADRARADGCSYSQNQFSEDDNQNSTEAKDMSFTLEVADEKFEIDADCVECQDELEAFIEDVQGEVSELEQELTKTEAALDQKKDQMEQLEQEQPEPGAGEESGEGEGDDEGDQAMKLRLVMAIREEDPEYSFTDESGKVKSTEQVMKDALEILGGVNLEEATDELQEKLQDQTYLRARVDSILEDRKQGSTPDRDPEEIEDNGDLSVDEMEVEDLEAMDLEDLESIDTTKLTDEAATAYYQVLSDKRRGKFKTA